MHEFKYINDVLCCEGIPIVDIVENHKTPFYLYSYKTIIDHFLKIKNAFSEISPLICFSVKSNSNLNILRALVKQGAGMDIVSGGELFRVLVAGCPTERIVYASVGKQEEEIQTAILKDILFFNVESIPELIMIDSVAKRLKKRPKVALRINPDVKPDTHEYITTGTKEKKFGIGLKYVEEAFDNANKYSNVDLKGIHIHIGSQITDSGPFVKAINTVLSFLDKSKIDIEWLNIGGGFGIEYGDEKAQTADKFAEKIIPLIRGRNFKLILEPGRFISGPSGILVCKVLYIKRTDHGKNFAIVDAGMNDLIRPSLYNAYHKVIPVVKRDDDREKYDIVGPICESGDYLALDREMTKLLDDEYLAIMAAGAYGYTMASNYNSRPRPAELMVMNQEVKVIKQAETYKDLVRGEKILKELK